MFYEINRISVTSPLCLYFILFVSSFIPLVILKTGKPQRLTTTLWLKSAQADKNVTDLMSSNMQRVLSSRFQINLWEGHRVFSKNSMVSYIAVCESTHKKMTKAFI